MSNSIGFHKKEWKSVKFDRNEHTDEYLQENIKYVKFAYGPTENPEYHKPVIGRIIKIHEKGLEVMTDYGFMFPTWLRVSRVFVAKEKRVNITRVKAATTVHSAVTGLLDAGLEKIVTKVKKKYPSIKVQDDKVDLSTRYSRTVKFFVGHQNIFLTIPDVDADAIEITGSAVEKQSKIKVGKANRITPQQVHNITSKIAELER